MHKKSFEKLQAAQGLVEFALVLPLLLLVILGIFAFGHLFFVYSSVVSASREAARWGAAVGEAPSAFPRYQDCGAIRASAVRLGAFAGVNATDIDPADETDTGVEISYDHGPGEAGESDPFAWCPEDGEGPADVVMGDRIIVRVRVDYDPIVPVVNLPSFPLEATTFRTILRSVPVGEAPTAVDPCTSTTHIELDTDSSVVGQEAIHWVTVVADDIKTDYPPTGTVYLYDDGDPVYMCEGELVPATEDSSTFTCPDLDNYPVYWEAGERSIRVVYDPGDETCFLASNTGEPGPDPTHTVLEADTDLVIGVTPATGEVNRPLLVSVTVQAVAPSVGTPAGFVMVRLSGQGWVRVNLVDGSGTIPLTPTSAGNHTITVNYPLDPDYPEDDSFGDADPNYKGITKTVNVTVLAQTPTLILTPTRTLPAVTPTRTPLPAYCPRMDPSSYDIFQIGSAIQLPILNPNVSGSSNQNVTSVELTWPGDPEAAWQEIRLGASVSSCLSSGAAGSRNCVWQNTSGLNPTHQTVSSSTSGWNGYNGINKGVTELMRLVFNHSMPQGHYNLKIRFSNSNCVLEIDTDKVTP